MPRLRRIQLTDPVAERERVLAVTRNRHRTRKATETGDEKMKRLEHDKLYQQRKRSKETDEQRKKRLTTERTRHKKRKEMQNYRLHLSEEESDENESNSSILAGPLVDAGTTLISGMSNPSPSAPAVEMDGESQEQVEIREAESTTPSTQPDPDVATVEASTEQPSPVPETPKEPAKPKITLNLKTPKEKQSIQIDEDAAIRDIKAIAAEKFNADPDYLCLIFAGKMMEDEDTLVTHNIHEGMTIHLIIKTAPRQPEPGPQRPPADIGQTPFGFGNVGGLAGLESLGMGSTNFKELQNRLQTELLGNPELLRRVLDNPLVQTLMNDSDNMKTLIQNNPQMQDLMNRHPEIRTMLNNSELLKHTAELAKNPSMLQELMRNLDGTNPMDGSTTTFTTLPNLYSAFQEPGLSTGRFRVQEAQKKAEQGGIFSNPQMSSLLQQMSENPQLVQNMLSAPYTQTMLQALSADPNMASAIINENPLYRNNPALQQYLTSMMPQLVQQLQNPEVLNMMANPQAVNALLQIQEGLDQLKSVAPGLVSNLGLGSFNDFTGANGSGSSGSSSGDTPSSAQTTPTSSDNFSKFMSQMVTQMAQSDPRLPPDQRFKVQMEHLKAMGFTNEAMNLQTLTACFGDLNATIQRLLAAQNNSKVV